MINAASRRREAILLAAVCMFLFFYGLGAFGLLGADEPRYAQVAREMFERQDWITPTLGHQPWLEKPVLFYWEAEIAYSLFGVSDWAARLPSAVTATLLVLAAYLFLRRFRPGAELNGALMIAASVAVTGFARSAATDMLLAANFSIALLAWYAWYETRSRHWLLPGYFFLGLAVLAKGPVAIGLAGLILILFAVAQRNLRLIFKSFWMPGILVFLLTVLPWYIAVQLRNPQFVRVFILEHNLARFGTNLYRHHQPFWFYLPVALIGLLPWTALVIAAVIETVRGWISEGSRMFSSEGGVAEDALDIFLLIWLVVPVIFFSIAQAKLPGYILPALPAAPILTALYIRRRATSGPPTSQGLLFFHCILAASLLFGALVAPSLVVARHLPVGSQTAIFGFICLLLAVVFYLVLRSRSGLNLVHAVTLVPVLLSVGAIIRLEAPSLDFQMSTRPVALAFPANTASLPIAVMGVPRQTEYGLQFYRNQSVQRYERGEVPAAEHVLIAPEAAFTEMTHFVGTRHVTLVGAVPQQHIALYRISAAQ